MMRVTYSLPGLRRATVSVPLGAWLAGDHLQVSHELHELLERTVGPAKL